MNIAKAFDQTLDHFKLQASTVASHSGVSPAAISKFRNGARPVQTDTLERLIAALPQEAKQYFFLHCLVKEMDDEGIATLLSAISSRMRQEKPNEQRKEPELQLAS